MMPLFAWGGVETAALKAHSDVHHVATAITWLRRRVRSAGLTEGASYSATCCVVFHFFLFSQQTIFVQSSTLFLSPEQLRFRGLALGSSGEIILSTMGIKPVTFQSLAQQHNPLSCTLFKNSGVVNLLRHG